MEKEKHPAEELQAAIKKQRSELENAEISGASQPTSAYRISIELVSGIFVGTFLGYQLDKWLDKSPLFLIIGILLGVAGGALNIYKLAAKSMEDNTSTTENSEK